MCVYVCARVRAVPQRSSEVKCDMRKSSVALGMVFVLVDPLEGSRQQSNVDPGLLVLDPKSWDTTLIICGTAPPSSGIDTISTSRKIWNFFEGDMKQ